MYKRNGQGTELIISKAKKGFLIERNTAWSGDRTGFKALYYYSEAWPKSTDLNAAYNDYYDNGGLLYEAVKTGDAAKGYFKLLSKGHIVR